MKMMKTLLSVLLSLVLALGMFGAVAEEALLDGGVTLRNVVISLGEEEFALSQQARVLTKADENGAALRFELINGENVLLPLAGEIDAEGVRFTLDDSGRVYSVDLPALLEMAGLYEEDLAMLEKFAGIIEAYIAAIEAVADPANEELLIKWTEEVLLAMFGQPTEVEMDINGTSYPGAEFKSALTLGKLLDVMVMCENTGIAEYDALWKEYFSLLGMTSGVEISSMADLKTMLLSDGLTEEDLNAELAEMEMTIGGDEGISCIRMSLPLYDEASGMDAEMFVEEIFTAENIDMTMTMDMGVEEENASVTFTCNADMAGEEITAVDADMIFDFGYDYTYDDGYTDAMSTLVSFSMDAAQADGLWDSTMDIAFNSDESFGYEGDVYTYTTALALNTATTETIEADGSKTTATTAVADVDGETYTLTISNNQRTEEDGTTTSAVDLGVDILGDTFGLAFEINTGAASGLTALVGEDTAVYPLTDNYEDVAYTLLSADAMGLMADVMELAADETIMALVEIISELTASYGEYYYDEGLNEDQYSDEADPGEEAYEDVEYTVVSSFEEAAAIYPYEIPSYTAPEGFTLSYIEASNMDVYAEYLNADETDYIGLYITDFGMELTEPGAAEISYYDDGAGMIVGAEVVDGSSYACLYFEVDSEEAAEAIVAGLAI